MKKLIAFLLISIISISAKAETFTAVDSLKINGIEGVFNGGFVLHFDTPVHSACLTSGTDKIYVYANHVSVTADGVKTLLSLAMTGYATQANVRVIFDSDTSECWVKYLTIYK